MAEWYGVFLYLNMVVIGLVYFFFYKKRKLIGFHLGMNIAMVTGSSAAIGTGVILINMFPFQFLLITVCSTVTGMLVGSVFGGLVDYQTLLTGNVNGLSMGIMAPMVGSAASGEVFVLFIEVCIFASLLLLIVYSRNT